MRKLTADYILSPGGKLLKNATLIIQEDGSVIDLVHQQHEDAEYYPGILSPGFINTHCHLELTHLKGKISRGNHLDGFILEFIAERRQSGPATEESITVADRQMWQNGIQAVGDICNTSDTFSVKARSPIRYHSFVELFDFNPLNADQALVNGIGILKDALKSHMHSSIVPHAPYSVPPELLKLIMQHHEGGPSAWSIHNQESAAENELFINGTGRLRQLFTSMGLDMGWMQSSGSSSISSILSFLPSQSHLLFVHNTYTSEDDIELLRSENTLVRSWFSMCVKANMYIENRIPDIPMFYKKGCKLAIGTDSLASNDTLSILEEIKTIHKSYPEIPVATLLTWATKNGADYFNWKDLGSFTKNSRPGIIVISQADEFVIEKESRVTRLN